ncbi:hypothetical protein ATN00_11360 [Sphingobium baderi]|uniref:Uncharacterized protein n=1 Tax=Sphingobium baderi TaxID=1332080 RepID=A0A0S3EZE6_9SPHN|nr:hypothetical protein ATN00_11360 [Sphingobium baderi]
MRHNPDHGIMSELVQGRTVPVDRLEIRLRRRNDDIVMRRDIERAVSADAEIDAGRPDQGLDARLNQAQFGRRCDGGDFLGQAIALSSVEDREALQERNRLSVPASLTGAALFVLGGETVDIDDGCAALALPDIAAEGKRLAEGEPALAGETMLDDGAPENEDIDPRIAPACGGVLRHGKRRLDRGRAPGLNPGEAAGLQFVDDLVCDIVVKARPIRAGARAAILSGHRGSPRRAPETSSPALNPSRQTRSALSL